MHHNIISHDNRYLIRRARTQPAKHFVIFAIVDNRYIIVLLFCCLSGFQLMVVRSSFVNCWRPKPLEHSRCVVLNRFWIGEKRNNIGRSTCATYFDMKSLSYFVLCICGMHDDGGDNSTTIKGLIQNRGLHDESNFNFFGSEPP